MMRKSRKEELVEKAASFYGRLLERNYKKIVIGSALLAIFSLLISFFYLKLNKGIIDFYAEKSPINQRYLDYVEEFGEPNDLVIVIEGDLSLAREFAQRIDLKLAKDPDDLIANIFYKIDTDLFKKRALYYLPQEELKEDSLWSSITTARNANEVFLKASEAQDLRKVTPLVSALNETLQTGEMSVFLNLLNKDAAGLLSSTDEMGFLSSAPGTHMVIVTPKDDHDDFKRISSLVNFVRGEIKSLKSEYASLKIGVTGPPALKYDEFKTTKKDLTSAAIFALTTTLLIFMLAFREILRPFLGLVCLLMSVAVTFGFVTITIGHLTMLSIIFVIILIGLGTQYGIHIIARYEEERYSGKNVFDSLKEVVKKTYPGAFTGAVTTAAAFYATTLLNLKGFSELGFIAGSGVIICFIMMASTLPSLLVLYDRVKIRINYRERAIDEDHTIRSPILIKWIRIIEKYPKKIIIISIIFTIACVASYCVLRERTRFDYNLSDLQAKKTEAVRYGDKLTGTGLSPSFAIYVADNSDEAERIAESFKPLPSVERVEYLGSVVPRNQDEKGPIIRTIASTLQSKWRTLEPTNSLEIFKTTVASLKEKTQGVNGLEKLTAELGVLEQRIGGEDKGEIHKKLNAFEASIINQARSAFINSSLSKPIETSDLPQEIKRRFIGSFGREAIYIYPATDMREKEGVKQFINELNSVDPRVTGLPLQVFDVLESMGTGYSKTGLYAAFAIFLIFFFDFKKWRYAALATLPLITGILWVYGAMGIFNIRFNMTNLIAFPLILGIGADCGVHILHRYIEEGKKGVGFILKSTGKALTVAYTDALTSFIGIAFAAHQGLASLGQITILGVVCCFVSAMVILPAMLAWLERP